MALDDFTGELHRIPLGPRARHQARIIEPNSTLGDAIAHMTKHATAPAARTRRVLNAS
jgi:hypothetical protein